MSYWKESLVVVFAVVAVINSIVSEPRTAMQATLMYGGAVAVCAGAAIYIYSQHKLAERPGGRRGGR